MKNKIHGNHRFAAAWKPKDFPTREKDHGSGERKYSLISQYAAASLAAAFVVGLILGKWIKR